MTDAIAVSIDGALVAPHAATISVFDRGLLYGDGAFEVLRTHGARPIDLERHLDRLYETSAWLGLRTLDRDAVAAATHATIARCREPGSAAHHRVRIVLTRGPGSLASPVSALGPGRAIVIVEPLPPPPLALSLAVVDWPLPRRAERGHKTLAYLDHLRARELARQAGADEGVRLGPDGDVVEGSTSNLFVVAGGRIATPPAYGVLPGIVRGRVLEAWPAAVVRTITLAELAGADEIFVTSSLRGVVPITRVDGVERAIGHVTLEVAAAYDSWLESG